MADAKRYIVDSDVFITAKNRYYAFDLCPGFWKCLIRRHLRWSSLQHRPREDRVALGKK